MSFDLIDSNIIIYAGQPDCDNLRSYIAEEVPAVSVVSKVETLGYYKLTPEEQTFLKEFFDAALVLPVSQQAVEKAIGLRQQRRMSLGDALIAGTALSHELRLVTHNTSDFDWISTLELFDPLHG